MTKKQVVLRGAAVLAALVVAAALLRTLFTGLEIDEPYALALGFRLVRGDRLFATMWEPHQLSALTAAPLVAVFLAATGTTTGVLLFVRVVMLAVKAALSIWFYRSLREPLGRGAALAGALLLLAFTPKWFLGPDYVSQQFHYTVAAFLCWYGYFSPGPRQYRAPVRIAVGAVCACLSFLAYPQSVAAAPVFFVGMVLLGRRGGEPCLGPVPRGALLFAGSCAVCGAAFLLWTLQGMDFDAGALLERIGLVLHDPQYDFTPAERVRVLLSQTVNMLRFMAWPGLAAVVVTVLFSLRDRPRPARLVERLLWIFVVCLALRSVQFSLQDENLDLRHMYLAAAVAGGWTFWSDRRCRENRLVRDLLFWLGWLPGMAAYLMILRSTLTSLPTTFMYLFWPALCGVAALALRRPAVRLLPLAVLGTMLLYLVACRLWLVQTIGWRPANAAGTPLVQIEHGPAKGIWADQKAADMQECLYRALQPYAGQAVLQAIGEQNGLGFLMADGTLTVAQASVISGTDSDPRFETYYTLQPEKLPDVVLYDDAEVRDMAAFHHWIETNFAVTDRYTVTYGTASLQVLVVDGWAS